LTEPLRPSPLHANPLRETLWSHGNSPFTNNPVGYLPGDGAGAQRNVYVVNLLAAA
jgi:hypothetical protein